MKTRISLLVVIVLLLGVIAIGFSTRMVRVAGQAECDINFDATVRQGPSQGTAWTGTLKLTVDPSGSVTGALTPKDGSAKPVNVVGQANGRAINLAFDLGDSTTIFGVGTLTNDIKDCKGAVGGPFVGPKPGDTGDWGYAIGG